VARCDLLAAEASVRHSQWRKHRPGDDMCLLLADPKPKLQQFGTAICRGEWGWQIRRARRVHLDGGCIVEVDDRWSKTLCCGEAGVRRTFYTPVGARQGIVEL
jgi:hypothetical protein